MPLGEKVLKLQGKRRVVLRQIAGGHQKALKATAIQLLSDGARPWKKLDASLDTTYGC
jgi:acetolactate synthase regulatory subunit